MTDNTPRNSTDSRARVSTVADIDGKPQISIGRRVGNYALGKTIGAGTTGIYN